MWLLYLVGAYLLGSLIYWIAERVWAYQAVTKVLKDSGFTDDEIEYLKKN